MSVFAIGDIHGCMDTQMAIFEKIGLTDDDTLISVGDLVDRGPKIKEVLDWWLDRKERLPEKTFITNSNHDFTFIDWFADPMGAVRNAFMYPQGLSDTLKQLGDEAEDYSKRLSRVLDTIVRSPDGKYIFCHANYNWHEDEEFNYAHLWDRINGTTHDKYVGPIIVHGHTPCPSGNIYEYTNTDKNIFGINLDGGCVFGASFPFSCLRVLNVETGEIIEQKAID